MYIGAIKQIKRTCIMYIITKKSTTANKGRRLSLSVSFPGRMLRAHEVANVSR